MFFPYIVGNKDDCPELKVVEKGHAEKFAELMGVQLFETSAKENQNIEEVYMQPVYVGFVDKGKLHLNEIVICHNITIKMTFSQI